ncbi:MAG TPA: PEGA domain-containing protein [Blastocatellia bacterium]|nr:PEGA domain-containing protein [Blastocatellia bacterium]
MKSVADNESPPAESAYGAPGELQGPAAKTEGRIPEDGLGRAGYRKARMMWRLLAAASALILVGIAIASYILLTQKPSKVDQLLILTVPSGADVKINSKEYGRSPVKIEGMDIGTYRLEITKEGFAPVIEQIVINEAQSLERKLAPVEPPGNPGRSAEERIADYQKAGEDAFNRRRFGAPYPDSALYYADLIIRLDQSNQFAIEMRESVRNALHQSAKSALGRRDYAQALDTYQALVDNFGDDDDARIAKSRLEAQLAARHGEIRELLLKAEKALDAGDLVDPARSSAYYYSRQVLAIERQNPQARAINDQVKEKLRVACDKAIARGDLDGAIKECEPIIELFPEDKQLRARLNEMKERREAEAARAADPDARRIQGLAKYRRNEYAEAVNDLEFAMVNGKGTAEVIFSLAHSLFKLGQLDQAATYFSRVPPTAPDAYRSAIAALGDIALQHGDTAKAVARYKEARELGGSVIYPVAILDDKIEAIEKKQREKAAEPLPVTIQVRHLHGRLRGSCRGTLAVSPLGVRYDGEHPFASNVVGVGATITKDTITVRFQTGSQKFALASQGDGERFHAALVRYQQAYADAKR